MKLFCVWNDLFVQHIGMESLSGGAFLLLRTLLFFPTLCHPQYKQFVKLFFVTPLKVTVFLYFIFCQNLNFLKIFTLKRTKENVSNQKRFHSIMSALACSKLSYLAIQTVHISWKHLQLLILYLHCIMTTLVRIQALMKNKIQQ